MTTKSIQADRQPSLVIYKDNQVDTIACPEAKGLGSSNSSSYSRPVATTGHSLEGIESIMACVSCRNRFKTTMMTECCNALNYWLICRRLFIGAYTCLIGKCGFRQTSTLSWLPTVHPFWPADSPGWRTGERGCSLQKPSRQEAQARTCHECLFLHP